jgi:hypothetical protein
VTREESEQKSSGIDGKKKGGEMIDRIGLSRKKGLDKNKLSQTALFA